MDNAFLYILLLVAILSVVVLVCMALANKGLAQIMPYVASLYSLVFVFFALRSASQLVAKIVSAEYTHVYLKYSLPPVVENFAASIIMLASIPWFILIAKRGEE